MDIDKSRGREMRRDFVAYDGNFDINAGRDALE
jgi:hypothetical protein